MQKNKNKLIKSNKAITLIALVVTIVILVILAAVSITMVLGENGIFQQAKKAGQLTDEADAKDNFGILLTGLRLQKESEPGFRLADYLSANIGNEGIEDFLNNGDGTAQVAYNIKDINFK